MNGIIAQLVALTCHANAFLKQSAAANRFFPDNSTCRFCDQVAFVEVKKSRFGKPTESSIAATPDDWFKYLAGRRALGVRLIHEMRNDPHISDRASAGFVGGGGQWMLGVRYPTTTEYWMARWEVWDRNAPQQRIWRVTYGLAGSAPAAAVMTSNSSEVLAAFESALIRIHAFSAAHDCAAFTDSFARALQSLRQVDSAHGYHKDLYPARTVSDVGQALLDAAQSASVFGGMGSWNDMGFEGADGKEYEAVSEQLFSAVNNAICAGANESDRLQ